jgi:predicted PurR-regulated permease PerM
MSRYPTRFQQKTLWNAATGVSILILGSLFAGLIWLTGTVFGLLQPVLVPLLVAGIIAYLLDPVVRWLEKRGMKRLWAVICVFLALLISASLLGMALLPGIKRGRVMLKDVMGHLPAKTQTVTPQATSTEAGDAPLIEENPHLAPQLARFLHDLRKDHAANPIGWALTETTDAGEPIAYANGAPAATDLEFFWRTRIGRMLYESKDTIFETGHRWLRTGTSKALGFLGLILGMIMVPVYLFFFLKDSAAIRNHWQDYVPLKASRFKTELVSCLSEINGYLISFFRGQVLVALIDGVLVGISLEIYNLPYGFLIGIFMAILGIIPYIGNILCLIPACIIGYLHALGAPDLSFGLSPMTYVFGILAIFIGVQQINSLVTAPKIVGDSVGLHPLTVIFSMLFWSLLLGGFVGALLAVPLTAAMKVLFRRYVWERQLRDEEAAEKLFEEPAS